MRGVNKVIIVGNLGADPETRTFPNGGMVCNISVATSEQWSDKQTGERREATEWHRIQFSNRLAEIASQYLRKGSAVYVEGSLRTRKWQDQNGQDRYTTEIRATTLQMLGSNPAAGNMPNQMPAMGQPMDSYQPQNNQHNGFQNNSFNQGQNSFNQGNQMSNNSMGNNFANQTQQQNSPQQPSHPQGMAMSDAPADDDIPF